MGKRVLFFVCCICISVLSVRAEVKSRVTDRKLEIYRLQYSEAEPVLNSLKEFYAGDADIRMTAAAGKLFVKATDKQHKEIAALIKELDVKRKNVQIDVRFIGAGQKSDGGASLNPKGGVVYDSKTGFNGRIAVKPSVYSTSTTTSSSTTQILMAMSGTSATLRIGERVPYLTWIMDYGYRYGVISSNVEWQDVGSFLSVEPTIIGDGPMIRVKLVPELSGFVDGKRRRIKFVQAATEVTVRDGQSVQIGGANKNSEFLSRFLIGFDKHGSSSKLDIVLTPRIMGDMTTYKNDMINDKVRKPKGW